MEYKLIHSYVLNGTLENKTTRWGNIVEVSGAYYLLETVGGTIKTSPPIKAEKLGNFYENIAVREIEEAIRGTRTIRVWVKE